MVWAQARPPSSVMMGAITFTSWARHAIFTRSAWRIRVMSMDPTSRASSKVYTSSRSGRARPHLFFCRTSSSCWPEWYQTFHSSKDRFTVFSLCFLPFTASHTAATVWMKASISTVRARKLAVSPVGFP